MKRQSGFTVIEVLVVITFLVFAGTIFYLQKQDLRTAKLDSDRKAAINAMYYNLEEVYYPEHKYYPRSISTANLKAMDPDLFKDPNGHMINDSASDYRYEPVNCEGDKCKSYTLRAKLDNESDFVKEARH